MNFDYKCFVEKGSQVGLEPVLPGEHGIRLLRRRAWEPAALALESASQEEDLPSPPREGATFAASASASAAAALGGVDGRRQEVPRAPLRSRHQRPAGKYITRAQINASGKIL